MCMGGSAPAVAAPPPPPKAPPPLVMQQGAASAVSGTDQMGLNSNKRGKGSLTIPLGSQAGLGIPK